MSLSNSSYFITVLVQKHSPYQGEVWSQHRLPGRFYVKLVFWCSFVCQDVFFLIDAVLQSCRDNTGFIIQTLSYYISWTTALVLRNFADSDCLQSVQHQCRDEKPRSFGAQFLSSFFEVKTGFHENMKNNDTNQKN